MMNGIAELAMHERERLFVMTALDLRPDPSRTLDKPPNATRARIYPSGRGCERYPKSLL